MAYELQFGDLAQYAGMFASGAPTQGQNSACDIPSASQGPA